MTREIRMPEPWGSRIMSCTTSGSAFDYARPRQSAPPTRTARGLSGRRAGRRCKLLATRRCSCSRPSLQAGGGIVPQPAVPSLAAGSRPLAQLSHQAIRPLWSHAHRRTETIRAFQIKSAIQQPTPFRTFACERRLPESGHVFMGPGTAVIGTFRPFGLRCSTA